MYRHSVEAQGGSRARPGGRMLKWRTLAVRSDLARGDVDPIPFFIQRAPGSIHPPTSRRTGVRLHHSSSGIQNRKRRPDVICPIRRLDYVARFGARESGLEVRVAPRCSAMDRGPTMKNSDSLDVLFQQAVAAIDVGDVAALERLLAQHPGLVRNRLKSPGVWLRNQIGRALDGFFNRPYLLWFVTEDAVRTGQLSPSVAAIARVIIQAARRAGVKDLQKQLDSTLHFAVCSPIGRDDGRQLELLDVLVDEGAAIEGGPVQALICCNRAAAEHLLRRGARLTLPAAVCLERWDDLNRLAEEASATDKQVALGLAALNGRAEGLARLLPLGVALDAFTSGFYSHATPLHHAVWSGCLDAVKVLVEAGARLDTKDKVEHATPLGWAEYASTQPNASADGKQHGEIAAYLRDKGAI